jgi:hypothetical protein
MTNDAMTMMIFRRCLSLHVVMNDVMLVSSCQIGFVGDMRCSSDEMNWRIMTIVQRFDEKAVSGGLPNIRLLRTSLLADSVSRWQVYPDSCSCLTVLACHEELYHETISSLISLSSVKMALVLVVLEGTDVVVVYWLL